MYPRPITLALLAVITFLVAGCGGGSNSPQASARGFMENLAHGKIAEAKKFATEQTGQFLDFASSMGSIPAEPGYKFDFISEKIDGDKAVVRFKDKDGAEENIDLIRIDGEWKVNIKKEE